MSGRAVVAALLVAAAWACGGHVDAGGNDAGQDATTDARAPGVDAEGLDATPDHSDELAPLSCSTDMTQGGSSGGTEMDIQWTETCNDGNHYSADCWCPPGVCCCSKNGSYPGNCGPGGSTIGDAGAPYPCDAGSFIREPDAASAAWSACGFPVGR